MYGNASANRVNVSGWRILRFDFSSGHDDVLMWSLVFGLRQDAERRRSEYIMFVFVGSKDDCCSISQMVRFLLGKLILSRGVCNFATFLCADSL